MSGYCKWCGSLTNDIVKMYVYNTNLLLWSGCRTCFDKRTPRHQCPECALIFFEKKAKQHENAIECPQCGEIIMKPRELKENVTKPE